MANSTVFCTSSLDPQTRFEAWRESVGVIYEVGLDPGRSHPRFQARVESVMIDDIVLNRCTSHTQSFARPAAKCARDGIDHYMLQVFLKGSVSVRRGRRKTVTAGGGCVVALDLAETLDSVNTGFDLLNLFIPRRRLAGRLLRPDSQHAATADASTGAGKLLGDYIVSLYRTGANLGPEEEAVAAGVVLDLAAAVFNAKPGVGAASMPESCHALVLRARAVIARGLQDRNLGPDMLARQLNVSRARLYRAFNDIAGIHETIREMRLRRCFAELVSPRHAHLPIAEIADRWGFGDPAHFSRAFRTRFGVTPSDVRNTPAPQGNRMSHTSGLDRSYETWIEAIG
ncbi:MAG: helix-turn-helix domain-containing protein [Caulobacterales bacterium]|uniref:helix-turn-helix domain-containing protein n=1 Tax=Glycocaulis sp. TaxID=1969725 RepID=UPI003FA0A4B8